MIIYEIYKYFYPQEKSRGSRFCNLPKEMQNCVVSNLDFREFACLAATCHQFNNILKLDHNQHISCYLKSMLGKAKALYWLDVERCRRLNKISDITFFFRKCLNLYSLKFTSQDFDSMVELNEIIKSCPSLQEFKINEEPFVIMKGKQYNLKELFNKKKQFQPDLLERQMEWYYQGRY